MKALVPTSVGRVELDPVRILWLWGLLAITAVAALPALTAPRVLASLLLAFVTLCLGHSVGLHRGIIHRTYRCGPWLRGTLAWLFVLTGLGGPMSWARLHAQRDFWQSRSDCPPYFAYRHSLPRDFWWNLHLRFVPADGRAEARLPSDVLGDRWLGFLERTWPLHVLALALLVGWLDGPGAVAVCVGARSAAGILGHWFIGYAAHRWGPRPHPLPGTGESGTNVWLLGCLSFGEGFHNNHHAFPRSARMGLRAHELDLGWLVLRVFAALGLVRELREASASPRVTRRPATLGRRPRPSPGQRNRRPPRARPGSRAKIPAPWPASASCASSTIRNSRATRARRPASAGTPPRTSPTTP